MDPGWAGTRNGLPRSSVALIIPVLNEEAAIGTVLAAVPRDWVTDVVVVDGGSRDRTVAVAEAHGARVLTVRARGYGRACAAGVGATDCEVLAFLDGDGSDDASELGLVLAPLLADQADLVLGTRARRTAGAMPFYAQLGNTLAAGLISALWHQRVTDLPSCKAIRRSDLRALGMSEHTYGWTTEMIVKATRRGLRIQEVPLTYRPRLGGESKVSGNLIASVKAAVAILRVLARHAGWGTGRRSASQPPLVE
jgi:glycosyltransferase involved in cell wall biosynthesis